jgi:hypothetical protein
MFYTKLLVDVANICVLRHIHTYSVGCQFDTSTNTKTNFLRTPSYLRIEELLTFLSSSFSLCLLSSFCLYHAYEVIEIESIKIPFSIPRGECASITDKDWDVNNKLMMYCFDVSHSTILMFSAFLWVLYLQIRLCKELKSSSVSQTGFRLRVSCLFNFKNSSRNMEFFTLTYLKV